MNPFFKEHDCCKEVVITSGGNNTAAYMKHRQLFTTYRIMKDKKTYMTRDGKYVIAVCDGVWMIQKAQNR